MRKDILYPLRRLHGRLRSAISQHREKQEFYKSILSKPGKKVLLLATPTHTNIGDSAIVLAEQMFLGRCGVPVSDVVEITFEDFRRLNCSVRGLLRKCSLVCWHGGGNMGTLWPVEEEVRQRGLKKLPAAFPTVIFPQTMFYEDTAEGHIKKQQSVPLYNGKTAMTIAAREDQSFDAMRELYPDTDVIISPDVVLSCSIENFGITEQKREGVLLCLREDKERVLSPENWNTLERYVHNAGEQMLHTDMCADKAILPECRATVVRQKMLEFAKAKLAITDRLHGMVFAALTGTPCIVLSNNHYKVSGTYKWISYLPYIRFAETVEQAESWIPEMLAMGGQKFDNTPLMPYFEELAQVVRKYANN